MSEIEPTAGDYTLAGKIANHVNEHSPAFVRDWSMASIAEIIARHVAEREAGLRSEIERLQAVNAELLARCKQLLKHGLSSARVIRDAQAAIARAEQAEQRP